MMNSKMEKIKDINNYLKVSTIRSLCINEDWFTGGTNTQYNKMFTLLKQNDFKSVALAIWLCSNTELTIEEIEEKVITELYNCIEE